MLRNTQSLLELWADLIHHKDRITAERFLQLCDFKPRERTPSQSTRLCFFMGRHVSGIKESYKYSLHLLKMSRVEVTADPMSTIHSVNGVLHTPHEVGPECPRKPHQTSTSPEYLPWCPSKLFNAQLGVTHRLPPPQQERSPAIIPGTPKSVGTLTYCLVHKDKQQVEGD